MRRASALLLCALLLTANGASARELQRKRPPTTVKRLITWILDMIDLPKP